MKYTRVILTTLIFLIFVLSLAGCDTIEDVFEDENEVTGVIESIGDDALTVDGIEYTVTDETEYEGVDGLDDLSVGDRVEIEYKNRNGGREAVEIELDRKGDGNGEFLSLALCALDENEFSLEIDNDFFPLPVGRQLTLEGIEEDEGEEIELRLQITVLDETEDVGGVPTRVVEEREWEDDELIEVSRNFFSQTDDGTVCYHGEDVEIYEDGEIVSNEGAWRADEPGHAPGIFMPADPEVGMRFQQELAPGIAEDLAEVLALGEEVTVPFGTFGETLRTVDWNPLEGEMMSDGDEKVYVEDLGIIIDGPAELVDFTE